MTLKLKILPRAQEDVQHIFEYLAERSPQGAADWWEAFEPATRHATDGLVEQPLAPENNSTEFELRQGIFKTRAGRRYRHLRTAAVRRQRVRRRDELQLAICSGRPRFTLGKRPSTPEDIKGANLAFGSLGNFVAPRRR